MPAIKISEIPETVPDAQTEVVTGKSRERDETQRGVDARMETLVAEWRKRGKPAPGHSRFPSHRFAVPKTDVSALKDVIRRAATLHKVQSVFFKDHVRDDGLVSVKFGVAELPPKPAPAANGSESQSQG